LAVQDPDKPRRKEGTDPLEEEDRQL